MRAKQPALFWINILGPVATAALSGREPQPWYLNKADDAVSATSEKREPQPWYLKKVDDAEPSEKREPQPWYLNKVDDADLSQKREPQPWYLNKVDDADPSQKREPQPWYLNKVEDAKPSEKREPQPWYLNKVDDAVPTTEAKREPQPWYLNKADDTIPAVEQKREPQPWYLNKVDDAVPDQKREPQPWYLNKANDAIPTSEKKREPQPWYLNKVDDASDNFAAGVKREPQPWYLNKVNDASVGTQAAESQPQPPQSPFSQESTKVKRQQSRAASFPFRPLASRSIVDTATKRSTALAEHEAENAKLRAWVYDTMRQDKLRDTSDRGRKLLEYTVKPATDRVDREHIPTHLEEVIEGAVNDQERVSLLNYYLQVTGREPRVASELGWNRTRDEPTLLENDEIGYGYALGSQHQHHCADTLADAIDLGKDNINDFWMFHIIHCLAVVKIYSEKLDFYHEPVQPLTDIARSLLEKGYAMEDCEEEDGSITKQGMIYRNPEFASVISRLESVESRDKQRLSGWLIALIVEASLSTLLLMGMAARWAFRVNRRVFPFYTQVMTDNTWTEEEKLNTRHQAC